MPEISIKDQIKRIVELQKVDGGIYRLKVELREKPAVLDQLKSAFEAHKGALVKLEEKLKNVLVGRKEQELELKVKEDEIAKANAQLLQLKTNKEYTAKISEIEHVKADKSIFEEKILISYDESDAVSAQIDREKAVVAQEEKSYSAKKKEVDDGIKIIEDRIKVLDSQRRQAAIGVDPVFLSRYERILQHKEGVAIVPVQGNICGGCFMNIPSQQQNAIKMYDQLVECQMCSRILYIDDDL